jgi:hypothetical protein
LGIHDAEWVGVWEPLWASRCAHVEREREKQEKWEDEIKVKAEEEEEIQIENLTES